MGDDSLTTRTWQTKIYEAVEWAAEDGVSLDDLQGYFEECTEACYVDDGDQENPGADNVYDMMKDRSLGLDEPCE